MASGYKFTEAAQKVLEAARDLARENSNSSIVPAHIAAALLDEGSGDPTKASSSSSGSAGLFVNVLQKAGATVETIRRNVSRVVVRLPAQDPPPDDISFSGPTLRILQAAQKASKEGGDSFIGTIHLIVPVCKDSSIAPFIKEAGTSDASIQEAVNAVKSGKKVDSASAEESFEALSKYAVDLTALAAEGKLDPVIARDDEIRRCIRILSRRSKNNPVLIGEPGVGKSAVAEGLAQRIVARDVPVNLLGKLYSLDMGALMAGASYKGQYEERIKSVIDECEKSDNVILFIDEMHLLVAGKGDGSGGMDAANLLKPSLARGRIRCIGATTLGEYRKYIEKDPALARRFQEVQIAEPTVPAALSILRGIRERYELHHGVTISDAALVQAVVLAHRYLTSRRLPDSAIDLVDEACAAVRVARDSQPEIIDKLERERTQLQIELHALEREKERSKGQDEAANDRLAQAQASLHRIDDELAPLKAQYEATKYQQDEIQAVKKKLDEMQNKIEAAMRINDIATASDIRHYAIPDLTARLEKLEKEKKQRDTSSTLGDDEVTPDAIAEIVSRWTGIPASALKQTEKEKLLRLESRLAKEVVGQPEALKAIANAIRLSRSGLADETKPIASFLFVGPSGTGKTATCKELARQLFNDPDCICRIDGSEYSEKHSISRLIGAPPGYVGHDEAGQLTEFVRRKPYSIVVVDEIEKAAREFVLLFLQVLDDGRLTDSQGRVVSFRQCIIIMTSNLGSQYLNALPPDSKITPEASEGVHNSIRAHFPPEFINRISSIIIFNPLGRKQVTSIVNVRLAEVQKRLAKNGKNIKLEVDDQAKSWLADIGYQPAYGARPLNRAITNELLNPLSRLIIQDQIRDGETARVTADTRANRLVIIPNHEPSVSMDENGMDVDDVIDEDDVRIEELD